MCVLYITKYDIVNVTRIQSNLSYVTSHGNSEIWSHKTGLIDMKCTVKGSKKKGHIIQDVV